MVHVSSSLLNRYRNFMNTLDDPSTPPPRVFEPLSPQQLSDLKLIREVSAVLQKAKDDDEQKKAKEAENEAQAENKKEEVKENPKDSNTES